MCGIVGIFNRKDAGKLVVDALEVIKYRGKDGFGACTDNECNYSKTLTGLKVKASASAIGHALHSVVSLAKQPFVGKGKFIVNCEIYNWKELNEKYRFNASNDAEALFKLIERNGVENAIKELDGVYAFAYWTGNELCLARDILGEKPVWYSHKDGFAFASEKKALAKLGYMDAVELNPRQILKYDISGDKVSFVQREFFSITPEDKRSKERIKVDLKEKIIRAISKRIPDKKFGLLLSGGVDSALIAYLLKQMGHKFTCYVAVLDEPGMSEPEDLYYAQKIAKELRLKLKVIKIKLKDAQKYLKQIVPLIEDSNVVKAGVGLTFFAACKQAQKDRIKIIFSGLGSEEIFGGYQRHKNSLDINKECLSGLLKIYERDLYRDDVVTMYHNIELRLPFLDTSLVDFALKIPAKHKIVGEHGKYILRELASDMGLSSEFAWRKKRAAQYGSKFDRAIEKLAHINGFKYKSEYLRQFYPGHNLRLGALISSGKDSLYATYVMLRQNYSADCFITLVSKNPDSFMFHTPNIHMVKLQSECAGIPLIEQETLGEKEKELRDLETA
ncbi:MAG TPA: asparagine synthase-related protein, partial [Candidatus Nanoarchaeia archaeon]|nr:asparagine synthase-related protein [Candidatus Nanoarchaeia archaeon]